MNTSLSKPDSFVIETRYVWGSNITTAMKHARYMEQFGWDIQGNPAPMSYNGKHGTGVAISRKIND